MSTLGKIGQPLSLSTDCEVLSEWIQHLEQEAEAGLSQKISVWPRGLNSEEIPDGECCSCGGSDAYSKEVNDCTIRVDKFIKSTQEKTKDKVEEVAIQSRSDAYKLKDRISAISNRILIERLKKVGIIAFCLVGVAIFLKATYDFSTGRG